VGIRLGYKKTHYQVVAMALATILVSGAVSGSAPIVFADIDDKITLKQLIALALKAKAEKKIKDPCKCKGVSELVLSIPDGLTVDSVTDKKGKPIPWIEDETLDTVTITPIAGKDKLPSEITITLDNGEVIKIHTSCSQPIFAGDVHGSLIILSVDKIPPSASDPLCNVDTTDTKDPKIKIKEPKKNKTVDGPTITVKGTATDKESGILNVMVKLDGTGYMTVFPDSKGKWEATFTGVPDGDNVASAKATDNAGNDKRTSVKFTVE